MVKYNWELQCFTQISKNNQLNFIFDYKFFGITEDYKQKLHTEIFDFIYECKGAITFNDVYSMPVSIRNFYISRLIYKLNEKAEAINKAKRKR